MVRAGIVPRLLSMVGVLLTSACARSPDHLPAPASLDATGALLPDTTTIDGVLTMRHGADAFARAPQYTIDPVPLVVFDGGDHPDFDLTAARRLVPLPDGGAVGAVSIGQGRVMLFAADGTPERLLARWGQGPGEVMSPLDPMILGRDTIVIIDGGHLRVNWFTRDSGLVRSEMLDQGIDPFCFRPAGQWTNGRLVALNGCQPFSDSTVTYRVATAVVTMDLRYGMVDTVAVVPGVELAPFESRYRGRRTAGTIDVRFGPRAHVAAWDSVVAIATDPSGYVIDRRLPAGSLVARLHVAVPRRAVTTAMVQDEIDRELARFTGPQTERMVDPDESRRQVREQPVADSLPSYAALIPGSDGLLWVLDFATWLDSTVTLTAFRGDGGIVARLTIPRLALPVWVGSDRVVLREVDDDGVVRFGVYRMVKS